MDSWLAQPGTVVGALPAEIVTALGLVVLVGLAWTVDLLGRKHLVRAVSRMTRNTRHHWDDVLTNSGVVARIAHILPALVVYFGLPLVPGIGDALAALGRNLTLGYVILMGSLAAAALLTAANAVYEQLPMARERPLKGFVQVAKIVLFVLTAVLILAVLLDRNPVILLSGLGAMTAVLLLVFKDTILSLVASVQLSSLDMLRVGDWIEMPSCSADGDVVDIALHTVKVQNWDKTITTIPTHKLIAESFKNWRGMQASGGRRIKRGLYIDVSSIRFLSDEELEKFKGFALLKAYIETKEAELAEHNDAVGDSANINLRRLTNIGTFRAYVFNYLRSHPRIREDMTLLVRQLQPGPQGLPLEVYAFTSTVEWGAYEDIQADTFDHLIASIGDFGLRLYQEPSDESFTALARGNRAPAATSAD